MNHKICFFQLYMYTLDSEIIKKIHLPQYSIYIFLNENTSIMVCIIPHNLPRNYIYEMLQLQEHNYFEGGHFENGPYSIVHPKYIIDNTCYSDLYHSLKLLRTIIMQQILK